MSLNSSFKYDVFISYSTTDEKIANEICHILEQNNLKCWIAPRNISSGRNYIYEIADGIRSSRIVVLVYSTHSQESKYVNNEINMAFSNDKPILSFNIDKAMPSEEMSYYLKVTQWLTAYPNPEEKFETLVRDALKLCDEETNVPITVDLTNFKQQDLSKHKKDFMSLVLLVTPLYWASFVYMGIVSDKKPWILMGFVYLIPTLMCLAIFFQIWGLLFMYYPMFIMFVAIFVIFWMLAIIHAFVVRNEFLTRKSVLRFSFSDDELFEYLYEEYIQI